MHSVYQLQERYQVERIMASTGKIDDDGVPLPDSVPNGNNNGTVQ